MTKIAHLSDTHIRNIKYHGVYREVFEDLYGKLRAAAPDIILHCGDIAHSKTNITPEFVDLTAEFLRNLAGIAPLYILLGNHDGTLTNKKRQDAITPVVQALAHSNIHLFKYSDIIEASGCRFHFYSLFDKGYRTFEARPEDRSMPNVAVYHGPLKGSVTDVGWEMKRGVDLGVFDEFDFVMLGDIHKANQVMDSAGRARYAGSTVQQNFGEDIEKGFLLWSIKTADDFSCDFVPLVNPSPFINVEVSPEGQLPLDVEIPPNAKVRLLLQQQLSPALLHELVRRVKEQFNPERVAYINKYHRESSVSTLLLDDVGENLRDVKTQEQLIRDYLKDYSVDNDELEVVFELNQRYNIEAEAQEDVRRNVKWKLISLSWDNYFNYGEGNFIDFTEIDGLWGIFGKNYSGKSSIIDSLLFTIFNNTSKKARKSVNVVNQNKPSGQSRVVIEVEGSQYIIERRVEKYTRKLKGVETEEGRVTAEFYKLRKDGTQENLSGDTRRETEKNIRSYFGTLDDFILTSLSSQFDNSIFIDEGSTQRRAILARFLDLDIFEKKFLLAKEASYDTRVLLKNMGDKNYDKCRKKLEDKLEKSKSRAEALEQKIEGHQARVYQLGQEKAKLKKRLEEIQSVPSSSAELLEQIDELDKQIQGCETAEKTSLEKIENLKREHEEALGSIAGADEARLKEVTDRVQKVLFQFGKTKDTLRNLEEKTVRLHKKMDLLDEVPCGPEYSHCKFIRDAYQAKGEVAAVAAEHVEYREKSDKLEQEYKDLKGLKEEAARVTLVKKQMGSLQSDITASQLAVEKGRVQILKLRKQRESLDAELETALKFESRPGKNVVGELKEKSKILTAEQARLSTAQAKLREEYQRRGSLSQELKQLDKEAERQRVLESEYRAYELFLRCMHNAGISYNIIKQKLPQLNREIAFILSSMVEFEIFFEHDGKRLDIFIKHPKYDPRPIEMASGAEKTIASMAIRLALLNITNLPKCNFFVMDEPAFFLDQENMEGFSRLLESVRNYFDASLLISHLDVLKDAVDYQVTLEKQGAFAQVVIGNMENQ